MNSSSHKNKSEQPHKVQISYKVHFTITSARESYRKRLAMETNNQNWSDRNTGRNTGTKNSHIND